MTDVEAIKVRVAEEKAARDKQEAETARLRFETEKERLEKWLGFLPDYAALRFSSVETCLNTLSSFLRPAPVSASA